MVDFIKYIHTDSLFIDIYGWIKENNLEEKFDKLTEEQKIKYVLQLSKEMEKELNDFTYNEVQVKDFASQEKEYKLNFKQEIIARSILIVAKAKYGYWLVNKEGIPKDEIAVTGLDIIRSETSKEIKNRLKDVMKMILKNKPENEITDKIIEYKKEIKQLNYNDIAANITVNNIEKYINENGPKKGAPWHVKGVYAYNILLKKLNLQNKYEPIKEGEKAKVIYLKPNKYGFKTLTYNNKFPKEILNEISIDIETMIEKFFTHKIEMLLKPCNKIHILNENSAILNMFFN